MDGCLTNKCGRVHTGNTHRAGRGNGWPKESFVVDDDVDGNNGYYDYLPATAMTALRTHRDIGNYTSVDRILRQYRPTNTAVARNTA
jgi:hypothetical protein